jgi:hypothetical protein
MIWPKIAGVSILLVCAAVPQDNLPKASSGLAPEVLLLSRIKRHLRDELAHIPNYTCLETVSRFRNDSKSPLQTHKGLERQDTIRLEIVFSDHSEWYGSPGARDLSANSPISFIGGGMIGNGAFAMTLNNIVEGGIFTYRGDVDLEGRPAVKYDFRVPALLKPLQISVRGGVGTVGEEGSIWVNPQSLDLMRLESHAVEIPPFLPVVVSSTAVDYARMRIGDSVALLAQQADSTMVEDSGVESFNRMDFTHCRSFGATSAIRFEAPQTAAAAAAAPPSLPAPRTAVPAFLEVTVLLTTPLSDSDAVGKLIEGRVSGNVMYKGKVAVPDGALVHGRVRRLERYPDKGVYGVGLEFTEVEAQGEPMPFYADLLRLDKDPRIELGLTRRIFVPRHETVGLAEEAITLPELPGVASFFIKGPTFTLSNGFRMVWRTRGQIH